MRPTKERVMHDKTGVGVLINMTVNDELLPVIPDLVKEYVYGEPVPGLCLHGAFGSGKTWIGFWAARELLHQGIGKGLPYWNPYRFVTDYEKYRSIHKMMPMLRIDDEDWRKELLQFEVDYREFCSHQILMVDNLDYNILQPWHLDALWQLIEDRVNDDLRTIVVMRHLPEKDSATYSLLASRFVVVDCGEG